MLNTSTIYILIINTLVLIHYLDLIKCNAEHNISNEGSSTSKVKDAQVIQVQEQQPHILLVSKCKSVNPNPQPRA